MNTTSMYTRAVLSLIGCLRVHHVYVAGQIFCSHLLCPTSYLAVLESTKLAGSNEVLSLDQLCIALTCFDLICFAQLKSTQPCKALFAQLGLNLLIRDELLMQYMAYLMGLCLCGLVAMRTCAWRINHKAHVGGLSQAARLGKIYAVFFCGGERLFRAQCACCYCSPIFFQVTSLRQ